MAIVEVHYGKGRVGRVTITREQPVVFGSSPQCDIILDGPGVQPFHGRIRWDKRRYKVDAANDVDAIEVDGMRVKSKSIYQGSEIEIGSCRIFLINDTEGKPREEPTRVQAPPKAAASRKAAAQPAPAVSTSARPEDLAKLKVAPPSLEVDIIDDLPVIERVQTSEERANSRKKPQKGIVAKLAKWRAEEVAPGYEKVVGSPLFIGLVATLFVLGGLGYGLWIVIQMTNSERSFDQAMAAYTDGDYRNAAGRFDRFVANYPDDKRADKALVLGALSGVKQFAGGAGPSWANVVKAAREMVEQVGENDSYEDIRLDLAEVVLLAAEGLADRATFSADPNVLAEAENAIALHSDLAGQAANALYGRSKVPKKLADAKAAVLKSKIRTEALATMDKALADQSVNAVYASRDKLVARYSDLATDRQVVAKLTAANEILRANVHYNDSRRPAETERNADPLGPVTTLVLRSELTHAEDPTSVVFALADGMACGIDARNGAPIWQFPVGLSSPFVPQPVGGRESTALVIDARTDELLKIQTKTGELVWRQSLGEAVDDSPLVLGNQIIQTLPSGSLLFIDLGSGEVVGSLEIGRPLTKAAVADEAGQYLYVLGLESNLFVIARDPASCVAVDYLGHTTKSIAASPARIGRFLVLPENHSLNESRWRTFVLEEKGAKLRPSQVLSIKGWTWDTPVASGSTLWGLGDRGGATAFSIGPYESRNPFTVIAELPSDANTSGPSYAYAKNEREAWVASGRSSRMDLAIESGRLAQGWTLQQAGPALAPIQLGGRLAILTQQVLEGTGVGLWAVEPETGKIRWRTTLGAPWPVPPTEVESGGLQSVATDGKTLVISSEQLKSGGFLEMMIPAAGAIRLGGDSIKQVNIADRAVIIPSPETDSFFVRIKAAGDLQKVELPAPLGAEPIAWDGNLFVPGGGGRAYLVDPSTGAPKAEPFVPPYDRSKPTAWKAPVLLDGNGLVLADQAGRIRRFEAPTAEKPRLVPSVDINLKESIAGPIASTGQALIVVTTDSKIRSLAARDLSPIGAWNLDSPVVFGPMASGGYVFASDASGTVHCIAPDGRRLWAQKMTEPGIMIPPVIRDGIAFFLSRAGGLLSVKLEDGSPIDLVDLGVVPLGPATTAGDELVIPVGSGSLRLVLPQALARDAK